MTPQVKLQRAKVSLLLDEPFFGTLLLGLKTIEDKDDRYTRGTMATDGTRLYWSTKFVTELSEPEIKTVLAHEVMHCGLAHMIRRKHRDMTAWNVACDHAVNLVLEKCNEDAKAKSKGRPFLWPAKYPPLMDPQFVGLSAEEIYNRLPKNPSGKGNGDGHGMGGVLDAGGGSDAEEKMDAQWKISMVQAATAAKQKGKLPADMERLIGELLNPPTPWQELLRRYVRSNCKDDYSFKRPNPRYAHTGFMLPSLHTQRIGRVAVAIDTSGSIGGEMLDAFMAEVEKIAHECRPEKIVIIDCDARVNSMEEYECTDQLPRKFKGGGGTSHRPVFEALEKDPPDVCICLTDLYTDFPDQAPGYDTIWAVYGKNEAVPPFGEMIRIGE